MWTLPREMTVVLNKLCVVFILLFCSPLFSATSATAVPLITDYHRVFVPCRDAKGILKIAFRIYYRSEVPYYVVVDPNSFVTETAPITNYLPYKPYTSVRPGYITMKELQSTPYLQALIKYTSLPNTLQNNGIVQVARPVNGVFLTVDMCPSRKPFEATFFQDLTARAALTHHPIPIAIAITGLWILGHPDEFNWLLKQVAANKLQITWINHSFSHQYYRDLPLQANFMLLTQSNVEAEILDTEKLLLQNHQLPSVFFRFPGLVSDQKLIVTLRQFGLIPVGSNAWLAKNQEAKNGSIILVHGNSNEPEGIKKVLKLLQDKNLNLLPLNQAF